MEMQYTPPAVAAPKPPAPTYELKTDMTGKPPPKRGVQTLNAVKMYEENDKRKTKLVEFQVPRPPNPKCKQCLGRGYLGFESGTDNVLICPKCYMTRQ